MNSCVLPGLRRRTEVKLFFRSLKPSDSGTPWNLCSGPGSPSPCGGGANPGPDQFEEWAISLSPQGVEGSRGPILTTSPQCDIAFNNGTGCAAAPVQSITERLTVTGPTTSTDNSGTFTTVWTWTAVP